MKVWQSFRAIGTWNEIRMLKKHSPIEKMSKKKYLCLSAFPSTDWYSVATVAQTKYWENSPLRCIFVQIQCCHRPINRESFEWIVQNRYEAPQNEFLVKLLFLLRHCFPLMPHCICFRNSRSVACFLHITSPTTVACNSISDVQLIKS